MLSRTLSYSTSDSALGVVASPHSSLLKRLDQKVTADISLLADQNAELMDKLEKLEAGASSSDQTGRRELKRLEKEIAFLREAFEKTQAKSEELEEKVHGAVTGEVWRKKQEREAKFRAMRYSGRYTDYQEDGSKIQNFAPDGSRFGGPSQGFPFLPSATSSSNLRHTLRNQASSSDTELDDSGLFPHLENTLVSQLLVKVQELEEANAQILKQQNETAIQLSAVQRDTEHIGKAYESRPDPQVVKSQIEPDVSVFKGEQRSSTETVKSKSRGRNADAPSSEKEQNFVPRDFAPSAKDRKSVMGLFPPDYPLVTDSNPPNPHNLQIPSRSSSPSWSEDLQDRLSSSSRGLESPGSLSPLHFFSPATQTPEELSPLESRPTLESELSKEFGDSWDLSPSAHHSRTSSLYDLSQFSVPATPCPASRVVSRRTSDELKFDIVNKGGGPSLPVTTGLLRLSIEPPTPAKGGDIGEYAKSPRVQRMTQTLRSRTGQWVDRRFKEGHRGTGSTFTQFNGTGSAEPASIGLPQHLSNAIDKMIEKFDGFPDVNESKPIMTSSSPSLSDSSNRGDIATRPARKESSKKKNVLGSLLFEVWLWFQFTIIIFVFIYAMAKRGPKGVLVEAERRRAIASAR